MKRTWGAIFLVSLILSAGLSAAEAETVSPSVSFKFNGGERIKLLVVPDPGTASFEQIVSDDGYIALPVGEPVNIKGKSLFDAYKLINREIERASGARKISASIALQSVPARNVYVGGEGIRTSASVPLPGTTPLTLYAAILAVGGVSPEGDPTRVTVSRTGADGKTIAIETYDISSFGNPGSKTLGPVLEQGDVVKVPRGEIYFLAGEVSKSGPINKREIAPQDGRPTRVSNLIYGTGGVKLMANRKSVKVIRTNKEGRKIVLSADLDSAEKGESSEGSQTSMKNPAEMKASNGAALGMAATDPDPILVDGDVVVVGASGGVAVLGKVRSPGVYALNAQNVKLTRLIAQAGGFAEFAKTTSVSILKAGNANNCIHIDLSKIEKNQFVDPDLEDGDLIYVGERLL